MKGLSREFLTGLIVIICIAIMVIGVNYLKGINLFDRPETFYALYTDVDGLTESNPVLLHGHKVGLVSDVSLHPNGTGVLIVEVNISDNVLRMPKDTKFKIVTSDLFGAKAIQVELGDSLVYASDLDTLDGELELDFTTTLIQEFEPLKEKAQKLIVSVDDAIANLNEVFASDAATQDLPQTFTSLKNTMENLEHVTQRLDGIVGANEGRINDIFTNVNSITENLSNHNETLSRAIENIGSFSDTLAQVQLAATIRKIDKAMTDFSNITGKINSGEGTLGELVNNDSLHSELLNASKSLDLLINDIEANPGRYLSFSVFGRKPKKELSKKDLEQLREEIDRAILEKSSE